MKAIPSSRFNSLRMCFLGRTTAKSGQYTTIRLLDTLRMWEIQNTSHFLTLQRPTGTGQGHIRLCDISSLCWSMAGGRRPRKGGKKAWQAAAVFVTTCNRKSNPVQHFPGKQANSRPRWHNHVLQCTIEVSRKPVFWFKTVNKISLLFIYSPVGISQEVFASF